MECLVWYLKSSKRGNDRVTSFQETSKKLPEAISDLKKATSIDSARSSGTGKSPLGYLCHLTFDFWAITLPSFEGTLTTWLLISGHPFALLFYLECDSWLVRFWFGLSMQTSGTNCLNLYGKRFL